MKASVFVYVYYVNTCMYVCVHESMSINVYTCMCVSEVTLTQKDKHYRHVLTHKWILNAKQRITTLQSTTLEKLGKKGEQRRDTLGLS